MLDPFRGSGTTLAVAKKLGRRYLGFELSPEYVKHGTDRLKAIRVGDRLDGSAEPLMSAPPTAQGKRKIHAAKAAEKRVSADDNAITEAEKRHQQIQRELAERSVIEAFTATHDGHSADRVVVDPDLDVQFLAACKSSGIVGDARTWNRILFRLRKAGKLAHLQTEERTSLSWSDCDPYIFASEIAWQTMLDDGLAESLDEILCDPSLAKEFDVRARRFAPGFSSLEYRWAALKLRKQAKLARSRGSVLVAPSSLGRSTALEDLDHADFAEGPGVYLLKGERSRQLYVGEALNLRQRIRAHFGDEDRRREWNGYSPQLAIQSIAIDLEHTGMLAWQSCLVSKFKPQLNLHDLYAS